VLLLFFSSSVPINRAPVRIQSAQQKVTKITSSPLPLKLGPRGSAEGTEATTHWFADDDAIADDRGAELSDTSRLEEGVRRVRALAAGALALLLPAALVGMAVAAGAAAREGERDAMFLKKKKRGRRKTVSIDACVF
jgi:hypothetical protein